MSSTTSPEPKMTAAVEPPPAAALPTGRAPVAGAEPAEPFRIDAIVGELCRESCQLVRRASRSLCPHPLPSRDRVLEVMELLRSVLFPGYFGSAELRHETLHYHLGGTLDIVQRLLEEQIGRGLAFDCGQENCDGSCAAGARSVTMRFLQRLPAIQRLLAGDVRAAYEGDPALTTPDEAIFCYPGIHAVTNFRLAHELHELGVPLLPRMISEQAHSVTGIDLHPGATIGSSFFMDHGTGIVIGETCIIGSNVRIYQGVTLGAKSFPLDSDGNPIKGVPRHPIIEDRVTIYSGATILGRITIGADSMIGGNVWLTRSVPPNSRVTMQLPRKERFEHGGGI